MKHLLITYWNYHGKNRQPRKTYVFETYEEVVTFIEKDIDAAYTEYELYEISKIKPRILKRKVVVE